MPDPQPAPLSAVHRASNMREDLKLLVEGVARSAAGFEPELIAMSVVSAAFGRLSDEEGARVLTWLRDRYHRWDSA